MSDRKVRAVVVFVVELGIVASAIISSNILVQLQLFLLMWVLVLLENEITKLENEVESD